MTKPQLKINSCQIQNFHKYEVSLRRLTIVTKYTIPFINFTFMNEMVYIVYFVSLLERTSCSLFCFPPYYRVKRGTPDTSN